MNIQGITAAAMATDTQRMPTNHITTAIHGLVGIIGMLTTGLIIGMRTIGMDGVMNTKAGRMVDGVMRDGAIADGAVADGAVDMVDGVVDTAVDIRSRTQDTVADTIAADPTGHRITPAQSCSVNFDAHIFTRT